MGAIPNARLAMQSISFDTIIVGAGPAGLGCALALRQAGVERLLLLERAEIGSSFAAWPREMRMITPSFHGNPLLQTDLNAINPDSSPADLLGREHPSGSEYAAYLKAVARHYALPVCRQESVLSVLPEENGFSVETSRRALNAKTVIWAGGEFVHPRKSEFPGADLCRHNSTIASWDQVEGDEAIIIGGYESGIDAAHHLVQRGKQVTVISRGEPWLADHPDPSESLSPYTKERLLHILQDHPGQLNLKAHTEVSGVSKSEEHYHVVTTDSECLKTKAPPILATGFRSALTPIRHLFEWDGPVPLFTENDASTRHEGLFYSGPSLIQRDSKFCFIYKFRARFGVIARTIAEQLGLASPSFADYARKGFLMDDLDCCIDCKCAPERKPSNALDAR